MRFQFLCPPVYAGCRDNESFGDVKDDPHSEIPNERRIDSRSWLHLPMLVVCLTALWCCGGPDIQAADLLVGAARTSITPDEPVALSGQFHTRVAKTVESPVTANVLVLESRDGDKSRDLAIMVSCDLVIIQDTDSPSGQGRRL